MFHKKKKIRSEALNTTAVSLDGDIASSNRTDLTRCSDIKKKSCSAKIHFAALTNTAGDAKW